MTWSVLCKYAFRVCDCMAMFFVLYNVILNFIECLENRLAILIIPCAMNLVSFGHANEARAARHCADELRPMPRDTRPKWV